MSDLGHFQGALAHYAILPEKVALPFSHLLPALEVSVGLGLLLGFWCEGAWLWSELLYYLFAIAVFSVKVRGLQIQCGCFGRFGLKLTWLHALICLTVAVVLTRRRLRRAEEGETSSPSPPAS